MTRNANRTVTDRAFAETRVSRTAKDDSRFQTLVPIAGGGQGGYLEVVDTARNLPNILCSTRPDDARLIAKALNAYHR